MMRLYRHLREAGLVCFYLALYETRAPIYDELFKFIPVGIVYLLANTHVTL